MPKIVPPQRLAVLSRARKGSESRLIVKNAIEKGAEKILHS